MGEQRRSFWRWLLVGFDDRPGITRIANPWLFVHVAIGVILALVVKIPLFESANAVLLPLIGLLIGLSFAWAGNAQALLQASEIQRLSQFRKGGFVEYVFAYQLAILAILVSAVLWGLAGLKVYDGTWPMPQSPLYFGVEFLLFASLALTIRICWQVVLGASWMLLMQKKIRDHDRNGISNSGDR